MNREVTNGTTNRAVPAYLPRAEGFAQMIEPVVAREDGPRRVDLALVEDVRGLVDRVVCGLSRGHLAVLPTDAGPALIASLLHLTAVRRLRQLRGLRAGPLGQIALHGAGELADWVSELPAAARKVARRAWPGPLTLIARRAVGPSLSEELLPEARESFQTRDEIGFRCPKHWFFQEVRAIVPEPLVVARAADPGTDSTESEELLRHLMPGEWLIEDGQGPPLDRPTVVRFAGMGWELVRRGSLDEGVLEGMAATSVLFVCTGNTCRSPMAEALFKSMLARRLGCPVESLEATGFQVRSAGLSAGQGMSAASNAIEVVRGQGGSLANHGSRPVTWAMVQQADLILTMTRDHQDALLAHWPQLADRTYLLDPNGYDIPDPVGSSLETYRRTARVILGHLEHWAESLGV